ncbi:hypothetical protein VTK56DRAFT_2289 [Thermocarpiscus australiensis]
MLNNRTFVLSTLGWSRLLVSPLWECVSPRVFLRRTPYLGMTPGLSQRVGLGRRPRPRSRSRLRPRSLTCLALAVFLFLWLVLPYDNVARLAFRWNFKALTAAWTPRPSERWVYAQPEFPVDLGQDVLVILKTGYGTRERVPAWLDSLSNVNAFRDILVIADYASQPGGHFQYRDQELPVHDMVKRSLSHRALSAHKSHPRVLKYRQLAKAVASGDDALGLQLSREFGWELDALKFISGLEFAYERFPGKQWYLLVDDDTFVVQPSLKPLLEHLDAEEPRYLGNAVGDFRARFAHGGSAVVLSHAAMHSLVVANSRALSSAHLDSLDETWGDRLLAKALLKLGIYLDETYSHLFNGEPPLYSKIRADRVCSPVISFHSLASPSNMRQVGDSFRNVTRPVLWLDLWDIYGSTPPWRQRDAAPHENWDHVGEPDEATLTIRNVATANDCKHNCDRRARACLAWTWETETQNCHISPWMIVGEKTSGKISGINLPRARRLETNCILY